MQKLVHRFGRFLAYFAKDNDILGRKSLGSETAGNFFVWCASSNFDIPKPGECGVLKERGSLLPDRQCEPANNQILSLSWDLVLKTLAFVWN